jgi:hypothetical protein
MDRLRLGVEKTVWEAAAEWFKNTPLLPQRVKSGSIPGFALLSLPSGEEPCPLSLPYGFLNTQPSPQEI